MQNSTLSGNTATTSTGGGIHNHPGTATVQNSTLSGNSASLGGGGIYNWGTLTVQNSTLSGNSAMHGGGIYNYNDGTATVRNSTLSGNSASLGGGGIWVRYSELTVQNSTLSGNSAQYGGGIHNQDGTVTVQNSIVARHPTGEDCNGTLTSNGYNIESGTSCGFTGTGDLQNVSSGSLGLGELANNGGPTQTRALGAGSVAIDHIPVGALTANGLAANGVTANGCGVTVTTDQRGAPRAGGTSTTGGTACDVGAYEYASTPTAIALRGLSATPARAHGGGGRAGGAAGRAGRVRGAAGRRPAARRIHRRSRQAPPQRPPTTGPHALRMQPARGPVRGRMRRTMLTDLQEWSLRVFIFGAAGAC